MISFVPRKRGGKRAAESNLSALIGGRNGVFEIFACNARKNIAS